MNILEKIASVTDRQTAYNITGFAEEFGMGQLVWDFTDEAYKTFESSVQLCWLKSWMCTDTFVGVRAYFLNEELICVSTQRGRKCDEVFRWVSKETFNNMKDFLKSLPVENSFELTPLGINLSQSWDSFCADNNC